MRLFTIWIFFIVSTVFARDEFSDKSWGVGVIGQIDSIPYNYISIDDSSVDNFIPLFYYENEHIYFRGLDFGLKLFSDDNFQFSILSRARLLSIPEELQNEVQGDSLDYGLKSRYFLRDNQYVDLEALHNTSGGDMINLKYSSDLVYSNLYISPFANLSFKNSTFNSSYYGKDIEHIDGDLDISAGFDMKYHIYSNFYLLAGATGTYLGDNITSSKSISDDFAYKFNIGIGALNDKNKEFKSVKGTKEYLRVAQGFATVSNLSEILSGDTKTDENDKLFMYQETSDGNKWVQISSEIAEIDPLVEILALCAL